MKLKTTQMQKKKEALLQKQDGCLRQHVWNSQILCQNKKISFHDKYQHKKGHNSAKYVLTWRFWLHYRQYICNLKGDEIIFRNHKVICNIFMTEGKSDHYEFPFLPKGDEKKKSSGGIKSVKIKEITNRKFKLFLVGFKWQLIAICLQPQKFNMYLIVDLLSHPLKIYFLKNVAEDTSSIWAAPPVYVLH